VCVSVCVKEVVHGDTVAIIHHSERLNPLHSVCVCVCVSVCDTPP
jgi:hypothetical protein